MIPIINVTEAVTVRELLEAGAPLSEATRRWCRYCGGEVDTVKDWTAMTCNSCWKVYRPSAYQAIQIYGQLGTISLA